jgi:hypothetical protein
MQSLDHDEISIHIDAPPAAVYALIADVTRMPEFSPEIRKCTWLDGATGPAVGARFAAVNKLPNRPSWTNKPVVTVADPGHAFVVERTEKMAGTVEWRYELEPDGNGTKLIESYRVTRPISWFGWFIIGTLFARHDRRADLRAGMETTLERIRAVAEVDHAQRGGSTAPPRA